MELENSIKDCISKELEKGVIEKVLSEKLEECIASAVKDMFCWSGDIKKVIEGKVKSVMIPYLENYDYSQYIIKLDDILVEVLKSTTLDNKKLLENFKDLMIIDPEKKVMKTSELYDAWCEYVAKEVDTDELDVDYDDGVSYEPVEVSMDIEYEDSRSWSSFEYAILRFECEHDEKMNFEVRLNRWTEDKKKLWDISYRANNELHSLKYLNKFEILLMRLDQAGVKLEIDTDSENSEIIPDKEPEPSYS